MIQKTWQWIKAMAHWLASAWRVGLAYAVLLCVFIVASLLPGTLENHLRYIGLAFELVGIGVVAYGLRDRWILFNRPTPLAHLRSWLERRPRWGGKSQIIASAGGGGVSTSAGLATSSVWRGVPAGASVEDQVAALEANIETLRGEQAEIAKRIEKEARIQAEALGVERQARTLAINEIQGRIETLGIGGAHLELLGLIALILGAILATLSTEIAGCLRAAFQFFAAPTST